MPEPATPSQIAYIYRLSQRLDLSLGVFATALQRGYGALLPGQLSQAQAAAVVWRLRRIAYGLLALPEDARDLFAGDWQEAA